MWKLLAVACALGACSLDEPPTAAELSLVNTNVESVAVAGDTPAMEAGREAIRLYQELAARLDQRGVTLEQLQAAVDAGDAERVRALFGFTPEEYAEKTARLQRIGAMADDALADLDAGSDGAETEGLDCKGAFTCSLVAFQIARYWPNYVGLGVLVIASAGCMMEYCEWRDGSGPRTKQP